MNLTFFQISTGSIYIYILQRLIGEIVDIKLPVNTQKFLTLRNGLVAPMQKAKRSVRDVIVTDMADDLNVSAILVSRSS